MSKLIMMRGLPASGKSTRAAEMIKEYGNYVRVNRDLLRTMLHFDKWSGSNEGITQDVQKELVRFLLKSNRNVIVDDTNMGEKHLSRWQYVAKQAGAKFSAVNISTLIETCIERDAKRENPVGADVIINMALQYREYTPEVGYVLCDIDGTLANVDHRLHYVKKDPKDWRGFFNEMDKDELRKDTLEKLLKFSDEGYDIILVTARPDKYKFETLNWLVCNDVNFYKTIIMRRTHDGRPDTEVKKSMLDTYFPDKSLIHKVIDDRPSVIRMWRAEGLDVIDVGVGIEF